MTEYQEKLDATKEALDDPQVGDRFHEMYSWWGYVVWREGNLVATLDAASPCTFPHDGKLFLGTVRDLQERYSYTSNVDKYIPLLADRDNDVTGWFEYATRNYR